MTFYVNDTLGYGTLKISVRDNGTLLEKKTEKERKERVNIEREKEIAYRRDDFYQAVKFEPVDIIIFDIQLILTV